MPSNFNSRTAVRRWFPFIRRSTKDVGALGGAAKAEDARKLPEDGVPPLKVFIVGPARSGTSILFFALKRVLNLPGFGESHVMPVFQKMVYNFRLSIEKFTNVDQDVLIKCLDKDDFELFLFDFIREFYVRAHGSQSWIDKTPTDEAAHGLRLIEAIFPEARILVTRRTGIEVVNSYLRKFNGRFDNACAVWVNSMEGIRISRGLCKSVLEVDQYDMANDPYGAAQKIVTHLGRAEFAERIGSFLANETVEKSSTHDPRHRLTLADVEWTPEQKSYFVEHCGKTMEAFEYPL